MRGEGVSRMLHINHFSKTYKGGKKAVEDLTLKVEPGDLYGFIGHNGAGKTTTLKAVVGILDFEEGSIEIDGRSILKEPITCKSKLAYIPDNPDLYEHLTGIQYLSFMADIYGIDKETRKMRIQQYGDLFELTNSLGDLIGAYSHGMKQKLAIIGALIHEPKLLILDEPFVGLDPKAAHTLKQIMKQMCEKGCAIFFSTHVLEVAEKLCNKIAIIKGGRLVVSGSTQEVVGNQSLEELFMELADHE